jgi:hypothetical protein
VARRAAGLHSEGQITCTLPQLDTISAHPRRSFVGPDVRQFGAFPEGDCFPKLCAHHNLVVIMTSAIQMFNLQALEMVQQPKTLVSVLLRTVTIREEPSRSPSPRHSHRAATTVWGRSSIVRYLCLSAASTQEAFSRDPHMFSSITLAKSAISLPSN